MDAVSEFLNTIRAKNLVRGHFRGLLNVLIGRRIAGPDGTVVSAGMTFRDVASLLKKLRWEPDVVSELGIDPASLPPRDRQRFWFLAICQAQVDAGSARAAGDALVALLEIEGYKIGPPPGRDGDLQLVGIPLRT